MYKSFFFSLEGYLKFMANILSLLQLQYAVFENFYID